MPNFLKLLKALIPSIPTERDRDEAYLAEAQNIADLERRIREVEARGRRVSSDVAFSLGLW